MDIHAEVVGKRLSLSSETAYDIYRDDKGRSTAVVYLLSRAHFDPPPPRKKEREKKIDPDILLRLANFTQFCMPPQPNGARGILFLGCLSVSTPQILLTWFKETPIDVNFVYTWPRDTT